VDVQDLGRVAVGMIAGVVACASAAAAAHAERPFGPSSPWNTPIPANPQLEPLSGLKITALATEIRLKRTLGGDDRNPYFATSRHSTPLYEVGAGTARQPVTIDRDNDQGTLLQRMIDAHGGVPFPPGAEPADGSDAQITVLDTSNGHLYEFWRASSPATNAPGCTEPLPWHSLRNPAPCHGDGRWHAEGGGIISDYRTDRGYFSRHSWPGLAEDEGWNWGATATSLPLLAGLVTFDDLRAGVIDHAVAGAVPEACRDDHMFPAQRDDGVLVVPTCIPEGARLQLDPAYDVEANLSHPITRMVARAAQRHGIIVRDVTHGNFAIDGQDPRTESVNPYVSGPGVGGTPNGDQGFLAGSRPSELFRRFPWSRLRIIAARHCYDESRPCPP
jgi:hypothetical protein